MYLPINKTLPNTGFQLLNLHNVHYQNTNSNYYSGTYIVFRFLKLPVGSFGLPFRFLLGQGMWGSRRLFGNWLWLQIFLGTKSMDKGGQLFAVWISSYTTAVVFFSFSFNTVSLFRKKCRVLETVQQGYGTCIFIFWIF